MEVAIAIGVLVAVPAVAAVLRVAMRRPEARVRRIPLPAPRRPSVKPQRVGAPLTLPSQPRERPHGLDPAVEEQIDAYVREAIGATQTRLPTGSTPLRLARGSVAPPPRTRTVRDVNSDLDDDVTLVSSKPLR